MIVMRLKGGLGNQMFQYALGRVLSIKNNTKLAFNIEAYLDQTSRPFKGNMMASRNFDLDVFNIVGRIAKKNEIPFLYRMYGKGKIMLILDAVRRRIFKHKAQELYFEKFNPKMLELGPNSYIDGFFQSPKYFAGFEDVIRKDFTLKNPLPEHIQKLSEEIQAINSVCIHVRRGDFVGNKDHEVVTLEYYQKGIDYISKKVPIEKIYVFSDDIEWCKNNITSSFPAAFVDSEYAGVKGEAHMFLMSKCKHFVIANSSFAWWAVWLSSSKEKIVVAPKHWFTDTSIDTSDLTPEEWIRI
jgi:hypothetical protein